MYYSDFAKLKDAVDDFENALVQIDACAAEIMKILGDFESLSNRQFETYICHFKGLNKFHNKLKDRCYLVRVDEEN